MDIVAGINGKKKFSINCFKSFPPTFVPIYPVLVMGRFPLY